LDRSIERVREGQQGADGRMPGVPGRKEALEDLSKRLVRAAAHAERRPLDDPLLAAVEGTARALGPSRASGHGTGEDHSELGAPAGGGADEPGEVVEPAAL